MDWIKLAIYTIAYIICFIGLAVLIPPYTEDKTYPCHVDKDGICAYPQIINWSFVVCSFILTILFIIATLLTLTAQDSNAYIMSLPEAVSRISRSNRIFYNIPPIHMIKPELERNFDGGRRKMLWYVNPFDNYKTNIMYLNMMSDYATTNTEPKMFDPLINNVRASISIITAKQLLVSPEKDIVSRLANIESELERRKLFGGSIGEVVQDSVEAKKERLRKEGIA